MHPENEAGWVALERHDATRDAVRAITARVQRLAPGALRIAYRLEADLAQLRIPPPRRPGAGEKLWQHTCFELFVGEPSVPGYHEFNFSPSGEWAIYAFSGYRDDVPLTGRLAEPRIEVRKRDDRLELEALIDLQPPKQTNGALVAGVSAVIEDQRGVLSYWALRRLAGKPDFHRPETFILRIDAVRN